VDTIHIISHHHHTKMLHKTLTLLALACLCYVISDVSCDVIGHHCTRPSQTCQNVASTDSCDIENGTCTCDTDWAGYNCGYNNTAAATTGCDKVCQNGGTCWNDGTEEKCFCAEDFHGDDCADQRVKVECQAENMTITFYPRDGSAFTGFVYVGDNHTLSECMLTKATDNSSFSGEFVYSTCDGINEENATNDDQVGEFHLKNLKIQFSDALVSSHDLTLNVSCFHSHNTTKTNEGSVGGDQPFDDTDGHGGLTKGDEVKTTYIPAYLRLTDESYVELSGTVRLGQKVYLQNYIEENNQFKDIIVNKCTATDPDSQATLLMIDGKCPAPTARQLFYQAAAEEMTQVAGSVDSGVQYSFRIFKIKPTTTKLDFSCEIKMCNTAGDADCAIDNCVSKRKRRSASRGVAMGGDQAVTSLRVFIVDGLPDGTVDGRSVITGTADASCQELPVVKTSLTIISIIACVLLIVVVCLAAVLVYFRGQRSAKGGDIITHTNRGYSPNM